VTWCVERNRWSFRRAMLRANLSPDPRAIGPETLLPASDHWGIVPDLHIDSE
jgi:hypothetical protein